MTASFIWHIPPEAAFPAMYDAYVRRLLKALEQLMQFYAAEIEAWMKTNAVWADRTGNARQGLHAEVETMVDLIVLSFDHGMTYGVFLEFANQGRFAIIGPALDHFTPLIWRDIQALLS